MSWLFHVRPASNADIPAIIALFGQIDDLHAAGVPYAFRGSSALPRPAQDIAQMIAGPSTTMLVAARGVSLLGHVGVELVTIPPTRMPLVPRSFGLVHDLIVDEAARKQGVGSALMAAVEQWVREHGGASVELTVWTFNEDAQRLYERLGYTTEMRRMRRVLG